VIDSGKVIQPKRHIEILTYTSGQVCTASNQQGYAVGVAGTRSDNHALDEATTAMEPQQPDLKKRSPAPSVESSTELPSAPRTFKKGRLIAARFGVSPRTIARWADAGLIGRHKVNGRVVLFDEAEVERFIQGCRVS